MGLPSDAYASVLSEREASVAAVQTRVRALRPYLEQVAAFYTERRTVEAAYATSLAKLARRYPSLADPSLAPAGFVAVASRLGFDLAETAQVHSNLDQALAQQCEAAVRAALPSVASLRTADEDLQAANKALAQAQVQAMRDQRKADGTPDASAAQLRAQHSTAVVADARAKHAAAARTACTAYQQLDAVALKGLNQSSQSYVSVTSRAAHHLESIAQNTHSAVREFHPDTAMRQFLAQHAAPDTQTSPSAEHMSLASSTTPQTSSSAAGDAGIASAAGAYGYGRTAAPASTSPPPARSTSLRSRPGQGVERTGSRRTGPDALNRKPSTGLKRSPSNASGGIKRVDSVSRGTGRHQPDKGNIPIKLADEPSEGPITSPTSPPGDTAPTASGYSGVPRVPPPQPLGVPPPEKYHHYFSHTRGASVPLRSDLSSGTLGLSGARPSPAHTSAGEPGEGESNEWGGMPLAPTRSHSSLRDAMGEAPRNPLKSAFSRFGKGKQSSRVPPPSMSTGQADARAQDDGPFQLKRSNTLGSILGRRRGKRSQSPSLSSRPTSPQRPEDGVLYDDTLRQIYRTVGTGPIETHNLAYSGTGPRTVAQGIALEARRRSSFSSDDEAPTRRGHRGPLPPPQPVFHEEVRKPSRTNAVQRWRSQHRGWTSTGNLIETAAQPSAPSPPLGSDTEDDQEQLLVNARPLGHVTPPGGDELRAALSKLPPPHPSRPPSSRRARTPGSRSASPGPTMALGGKDRALPPTPPHAESPTSTVAFAPTVAQSQGQVGPIPHLQPIVTETINVLLSGQTVQRMVVTGEVRLSTDSRTPTWAGDRYVPFPLQGLDSLERTVPNPSLLHATQGGFMLDMAAAKQALETHGGLTVFKYQVALAPRKCVPLDVSVHWKCEDEQVSMLLSYTRNPECALAHALQGIELAAPLQGTVLSARSKPTGLWDEQTSTIKWQVPVPQNEERILARFDVQGPVQPAPIVVRFAVSGNTLSTLSVEPGEVFLPPLKGTVAGKYLVVST